MDPQAGAGRDLRLPQETATAVNEVLQRYEISHQFVGMSRDVISEFQNTLKLVPASEWTRQLRSMPTGAVVSGKKIMISQKEARRQCYDVLEGRFLAKDEAEHAR